MGAGEKQIRQSLIHGFSLKMKERDEQKDGGKKKGAVGKFPSISVTVMSPNPLLDGSVPSTLLIHNIHIPFLPYSLQPREYIGNISHPSSFFFLPLTINFYVL